MKRTTTINICGKDYILCYSTRVVRSLDEQYGSPGKIAEIIESKNVIERIDAHIFILSQLIKAGARFAKREQIENPEPLSEKDLKNVFNSLKFETMERKIKEAIAVGAKVSNEVREIEGKNKKPQKKMKMTADRYIWYGLHLGLDYDTILDIPHGELLSLINEEQIQNETAEEIIKNEDDDPIPENWG